MSWLSKAVKKATEPIVKLHNPKSWKDAYNKAEKAFTGRGSQERAEKGAQNQREWEEYMSNTSHQREMADLEAAGLNPILSANGGANSGGGAAATSVAPNTAVENMGTLLNAFSTIKNAMTSASGTKSQSNLNEIIGQDHKNQIHNRNVTTAAGVLKTQAEINKLAEETKARAAQNKANEDLGLADNDTGIQRQIARNKYNFGEKTRTKNDIGAKQLAKEINARNKKAQAEFDKKIYNKLSHKESMEYFSQSTNPRRKRELIRIAKERGAF